MTTLELDEAAAKLADKATKLIAFAVAANDLCDQDKRRGGNGKLRDVVVSLVDGQTVQLYSHWGDDASTIYSSFRLPDPVAEKDFDAGYYEKLLEGSGSK